MKKRHLHVFLLVVFSLCTTAAEAQLTVVPAATAAVLAGKLAGPGVIVLNPVLTCATNAEGTFSGTSTLSFDSGIVLTSGQAATTGGATGVNGPASGFASTANGTAGDAQLTTLAGQPTYDACVLQFDFRPIGDTVKFQYVFGSEEYTDFTCSTFNDVFGFFITGPGYAAATNLAIVPGTNIPVCINSVNCGPTGGYTSGPCTSLGAGSPFCTYYVNNAAGTTITYDGLTTTLTAIASVTPCDTYHLKIGVADASDDILDSGVFLKAGSLTSISYSTTSLGINPADTGFGAQYCVRGCLPGMFIFTNTGSLADSITIHYNIGGTGVNGVDYTTIADSATIHAGHATDTVFIYGLTSATGTKTVELYILSPYSCGGVPVILDSVEVTIYDSLNVHIITPDTSICAGQSVFINTAGGASFTYLWSPSSTLNNSTLLSPTATPVVTTTYTVTAAYAASGCPPASASITITVVQPPVLNVGAPIQTTCAGAPLQLGVTVTPAGAYTYSWIPATYLNSGTISNPIVTPLVTGNTEYIVQVSSSVAGCNATDSFLLEVISNNYTLLSQDTGVCFPPGTYQVNAMGDATSSYQWEPTTGVSNPNIMNPAISPSATTTYTVTASYPGCPDVVQTILFSIEHPVVNIIPFDTTFCISSPVPILVTEGPVDSPYTVSWAPAAGLSATNVLEPDFFSATQGVFTYYVTVQSSLGCTAGDSVTLRPSPPANIGLSPAGNTTIMYGSHIQLQATNLSPNPLLFYWIPDNGTLNDPNINDPIATPVDSVTTYTVYAMNEFGCRDSAALTIHLDYEADCIPTAFTPNGDGLNDIFKLCSNMQFEKLVDFRVVNRWGQVVYENTNDPAKGWDGTFHGVVQDMGVYNYLIIIARPDGTNKIFKGDVTLIK